MKYSLLGMDYCVRIPIGKKVSGTSLTACTSPNTLFNKVTSACSTCNNLKCDLNTGLTQTCMVGYYFASTTATSCTICPAGSYCADGISKTAATI